MSDDLPDAADKDASPQLVWAEDGSPRSGRFGDVYFSKDDGLAETLGELAEFDSATTEAADLVGALVAAMAPPDRDIFLRKYYLLQSGKEIAAALGMSVESVNTRLSRGRDRLRRELTEKGVYSHA